MGGFVGDGLEEFQRLARRNAAAAGNADLLDGPWFRRRSTACTKDDEVVVAGEHPLETEVVLAGAKPFGVVCGIFLQCGAEGVANGGVTAIGQR